MELWHRLSEGHDDELRAQVHALDEHLEGLWNEHRRLRAELRWGDRENIIARARAEERLGATRQYLGRLPKRPRASARGRRLYTESVFSGR